jgi:hypothetical protein
MLKYKNNHILDSMEFQWWWFMKLIYTSVNLVHNAPVEFSLARSFPLPISVLYPVDPPSFAFFIRIF